ncbi:putative cytochrome p450 [Diplodia seriata]|uniref:Putative cytochrome p450 n=1 Tax=Diplodia seriata TaxID=420778 RepID=A0A0G2DRW9_9PEZI|nr:putative cytochrome p450 [Diplodia seriata]
MHPQNPSILNFVVENARPSTFIALVLAYVISTVIYRIFFHPLHKIPGPFFAKFTELWRTRKYFSGTWHQDILDLHRQYGPVVRLAPNEVSFVDKDALMTIYGHTKGTKKTSWYDVWKPPGAGNSFFNSTDPKEHAFLRKRVTAAYSMTAVLNMEARIQSVADTLWPRFRDFARSSSSNTIALHDWAPFFAFDVVGKVALGDTLGFVEAGTDHTGIIGAIHNYFFIASNIGFLPFQQRILFHPFTQRLVALLGVRADGATNLGTWMQKQVTARRERGPPPVSDEDGAADMLDHFLAMKEPDGATPAPDAAVLTETGNIIGAGADTTAIGIRAVLGQLMLHADSYARVQREVDDAYGAHGLSDAPGKGGMPFAVAEKLPFLDACVKEALRLHPSILYQLPREVPPQGVSVSGYYVPATATVSISPLAMNRCAEVFGPDADAWRPERWIAGEGSDELRVREMNKFNTTFGYGSRTCVGKNLALVEIYKFTAELLHQFDVELASKERPWVLRSMWFSDQGEMFVRIKERSPANR